MVFIAFSVFGRNILDALNFARLPALDTACIAFSEQHVDQVLCRVVAKQLAFVLLVVGNAVFVHQGDEVAWGVTGQGAAAKVRVVAQKIGGADVFVGEIGAATA